MHVCKYILFALLTIIVTGSAALGNNCNKTRKTLVDISVVLASDCNNKNKPDPEPPPTPGAFSWGGKYKVKAFGVYSGSDAVNVDFDNSKLHLLMKLKDSSGNTVNFNVPNIDISQSHFTAKGNAEGVEITVEGRFDAPAAGQPYATRFSCTYRDNTGKGGRMIGLKGP